MRCKDHVVSSEQFDLWQCSDCNFRFIQNAPAENEIGRYYDSETYMSHATGKTGFFNSLYQTARTYSVWWRYRVIKNSGATTKGTLLDIGCGVGAFAAYMQKKGWTVTALEPDADARKSAMELYRLQAEPMERMHQLPGESFDVITLWHVLEHVHDIHGYMEQIYRLLKKDGLLVIAVPNFTSTDAGHYKEYWDAYDAPRHLFHFSPTAMLSITWQHGFSIINKKTFWLDANYASLLSEQHIHGKARWVAAAWHALLSNLKAFTNKDKASAITYLLKKKAAS